MRSFRHWTPSYVRNRIKLLHYERRHPESPWLTQEMVEILNCWLRPKDVGLEWGSGRSTIWFAQRTERLVSIEHDRTWYGKMSSELAARGINNVEYHWCAENDAYISISKNYENESFDFCLVDGIMRDHCSLAAIPLLKRGGILIIDNCNWYLPHDSASPNSRRTGENAQSGTWELFLQTVATWRYVWTTSGVTDTAFWQKPK